MRIMFVMYKYLLNYVTKIIIRITKWTFNTCDPIPYSSSRVNFPMPSWRIYTSELRNLIEIKNAWNTIEITTVHILLSSILIIKLWTLAQGKSTQIGRSPRWAVRPLGNNLASQDACSHRPCAAQPIPQQLPNHTCFKWNKWDKYLVHVYNMLAWPGSNPQPRDHESLNIRLLCPVYQFELKF